MDEKQIQFLYDNYARGQGFKDIHEFRDLMNDSGSRKMFFDESNKELGFKDLDDFETTLGLKKKEVLPSPSLDGQLPVQENKVPEGQLPQVKNTLEKYGITKPVIPKEQDINQPTSTEVIQPKISASYDDFVAHNEERVAKKKELRKEAVDVTAMKVLKNKGVIKPEEEGKELNLSQSQQLSVEKNRLQKALDNGDATFAISKDGEIGLKKTIGFIDALAKGWNQAIKGNDVAAKFANMDAEGKVNFLKQQQAEKIAPTEYLGERPSSIGSIGGLVGENAPFLGKAALGTLTGTALVLAAPETAGASLAGLPAATSFLFTANDSKNQGIMSEVTRRFYKLRQENPNGDEVEQMKQAEQGTLAGGMAGIFTNAALMASVKTPLSNLAKGVVGKSILKAVGNAVYGGAATAGIEGAKLAESSLEGVKNTPTEIAKEIGKTFSETATTLGLLHVMTGAVTGALTLPNVVKSAFKYALKDTPPTEIQNTLKANVEAGTISPETAEKVITDLDQYKVAVSKTPNGLSPEAEASVAGLIQAKDKLIAEMKTKDDTAKPFYEEKIQGINEQIQKTVNTGKPYSHEIDEISGEKYTEQKPEEVKIEPLPSTVTKFPKPEVPISEMNSVQLEEYSRVVKKHLRDQENELFGEEGAKKYREAQSISNSSFASRESQKEADKLIDDMEASLTKEQHDAFFGINQSEGMYDPSEIRDVATKVRLVEESENVHDLGGALKLPLLDFLKSPDNEGNLAILNAAKKRATELNIDPKEMLASALKRIGKDLPDKNDAVDLAESIIEKLNKKSENIPSLPSTVKSEEVVATEDAFPISELNKIPKGQLHNKDLSKLKESISKEGIKEDLVLEYYPEDNALRLKEGHHRLAVAQELGLKDVPVKVQVVWDKSINDGNPDIEGQPIYHPPMPLDVEGYKKRNYKPTNIDLSELGFKDKPTKSETKPITQNEEAKATEVPIGETKESASDESIDKIVQPTGEGEEGTTSIKNEITGNRREELGLKKADEVIAKDFGTSWDEAKKKIEDGYKTQDLVDELKSKPRAISDVEDALLLHHQNTKEIELMNTNDFINKASESGDETDLAEGKIRRARILDELQDTYNATKSAGTETARGLSARRMMTDRRYNLVNMLAEKRVTNDGKSLTPDQEKDVEALHAKINETQKAYDDYVKESEEEIKGLQEKILGKKVANKKSAANKLREWADKVEKSKFGKANLPEGTKLSGATIDINKHVADGMRLIADGLEKGGEVLDLIKKVVDDIKKANPNIDEGKLTKAINKEVIDSGITVPTPKEKKDLTGIALDRKLLKLKADAQRAKDAADIAIKKEEAKKRTRSQKLQDTFIKWQRAFKLSNPVTMGKLVMAGTTRLAMTPAEDIVGGGFSRLLPKLAKGAIGEGGGLNVKETAQAYKDGIIEGMKDAAAIMKRGGQGKSDIDVVFGKTGFLPPEAIDFFGQLHSATKAPFKRFMFERSLSKRLRRNVANGVDVSDPMVQTEIAIGAYKDANRAIFMQDNKVTTGWQKMVNYFETVDKKTGKAPSKPIATTLQWLVPFVKVPTNIAAEIGTNVYGVPVGVAKIIHGTFTKGLENLPAEEKDIILRNLKKGTLGLAALSLGYFNPQIFGGYYQEKERRKSNDAKAGAFKIGGVNIPAWLIESPIFQAMQVGATVRRVKDAKVKGETKGIGEGLWAGALGMAEHVPMLDQPLRIFNAIKDEKERKWYVDELIKGTLEPSLLQKAAEMTDKADKRSPTDLKEHLEMGIPGLRKNVPEKNAHISKEVKDFIEKKGLFISSPKKYYTEDGVEKQIPEDKYDEYVINRAKRIDNALKQLRTKGLISGKNDTETMQKEVTRLEKKATEDARSEIIKPSITQESKDQTKDYRPLRVNPIHR